MRIKKDTYRYYSRYSGIVLTQKYEKVASFFNLISKKLQNFLYFSGFKQNRSTLTQKFDLGEVDGHLNILKNENSDKYLVMVNSVTKKYNFSKNKLCKKIANNLLSSYGKVYYKYRCDSAVKNIYQEIAISGFGNYLNIYVKLYTSKYRQLDINFRHSLINFDYYKNIKFSNIASKVKGFTKHAEIVDMQNLEFKCINYIKLNRTEHQYINSKPRYLKKNN